MAARDTLWRDHQRARWQRPDAHRWIKPDAQRFLKPGIAIASVFPATEAKYSPNQPRVPAGSSEGGQWTSGEEEEGGDIAFDEPDFNLSALFEFDLDDLLEELPDSSFDLSDIFSFLDEDSSLDEESSDDSGNFTVVIGDDPDVAILDDAAPRIHFVSDTNGDRNDGNLEPLPQFPKERPAKSEDRTSVMKDLGRWFGRNAGKAAGAAGVIDGLGEQFDYIGKLTDAIKSYGDPPRALEELQAPVGSPSQRGYEDHHIVRRSAVQDGISKAQIDSRGNIARIPVAKHQEITGYYNSKYVRLPDGTFGSPRDYLRDKSFEEQYEFGLGILRRYGVMK